MDMILDDIRVTKLNPNFSLMYEFVVYAFWFEQTNN